MFAFLTGKHETTIDCFWLLLTIDCWSLFDCFLVWVKEEPYSQLKRRRLVVLCAITRANAFSFHIPLCALVAYWSRAVVLHTTKSHSQRHLPSYCQETLVCHLFTFQFFRTTETSGSICYCSIHIATYIYFFYASAVMEKCFSAGRTFSSSAFDVEGLNVES